MYGVVVVLRYHFVVSGRMGGDDDGYGVMELYGLAAICIEEKG
jgi:hypothetical protein